MIRLLAAFALIGFAVAATAYFFMYAEPGDWLYKHKDWLSIVSALVAIVTLVVTLFSVILHNKEKNKGQSAPQFTAGGSMVFGNQTNTANIGAVSSEKSLKDK